MIPYCRKGSSRPPIMWYHYHAPALLPLLFFATICTSDTYHDDCSTPTPYRCGGIIYNISFPFSSPDRPDYCSNPDYNLVCDPDSDKLMTNFDGHPLQVKSIDYANQVLVVAEPLFARQSCPYNFSGLVLDLLLFNYTGDINVTLYLNCTAPDNHSLEKLHPITCLNGRWPSYYSLGERLLLECESTGIIPVSQAFESFLNDTENFWKAIEEGFNLTWMASKLMVGKDWCGDCIKDKGICGFDNTTADGRTCFHQEKKSHTKTIEIGAGILGIFLSLLVFCICFSYAKLSQKRKKILLNKPKSPQSVESFLENYESFAPKRYKYSEVKKMTKSFSDKLGHGGFGVVYKGELRDGRHVAVKILSGSKGNGEEFLNEVASIGRTSHVNIVNLLGFCYQGSKRALIYEFMPNGSLEKFIYVERGETVPVPLGWELLYKISVGIARGLEYLHRGCNTRIVHFDIKPHNILLDQDFCPKISDFGLAKLFLSAESRISFFGARGTAGFIAPEVFSRNFGCISSKSDVYSYGMMILEMVGGRKNVNATAANTSEIYFPHWIYEHMDQDGDLNICGVTNETVGTARKMILVGLWCIQTLPENRPSIGRVLEMLEGSIEDMQLPPKPYLSSPSRSMGI